MLFRSQLSGYFHGTVTNSMGCSTNTDTLLQIFPSFGLSNTQGCGPLTIQATNTTPIFNGMTCELSTNGSTYPLNNTATLNYTLEGDYSTSITCTIDNQLFSANGPIVSVLPNAPAPNLSSVYGAVLCSNCAGITTQYFLDNIPFAQATSVISTLQSGVYQNGYYTAKSISSEGCQSILSDPILVIQPALSFSPSEGCAPLLATFVNTTDYINGL